MNNTEKLNRIREMRHQVQKKPEKKASVYHFKKFGKKITDSLQKSGRILKLMAALALLSHSESLQSGPGVNFPHSIKPQSVLPINPIKIIDLEQIQNNVTENMQRLWNSMENFCTDIQTEVKSAKRAKEKIQTVKKIFNAVCPERKLSGKENYCVAGAIYIHKLCNDPILNTLLPTAEDINRYGTPTTYCPALMKYYETHLGNRYARKGSKNFKKVINNIKPGDILFVESTGNTASGLHCLTAGDRVKNGKLFVRGFNGESNYTISVNKIRGAVNLMDEYCDRLTKSYLINHENAQQIDTAEIWRPASQTFTFNKSIQNN